MKPLFWPRASLPGQSGRSVLVWELRVAQMVLLATLVPGRTPFGSGQLCLTGNLLRSPMSVSSSGGLQSFDLDFNQAPWNTISSGSSWYFQVLLRDFGAGTSHTSDALMCTFRP